MNINVVELEAASPGFPSADWSVSSHGIVVEIISTEACKLECR